MNHATNQFILGCMLIGLLTSLVVFGKLRMKRILPVCLIALSGIAAIHPVTDAYLKPVLLITGAVWELFMHRQELKERRARTA